MTVRPAPASQPCVPSHHVVVSDDCLLLKCGDQETVIPDESILSVCWATYCTKHHRFESFGYRETRLIHGRNREETCIALPWRSGESDPLAAYRERVSIARADSIERQLEISRSFDAGEWSIDRDCLTLPNKDRLQRSEVLDLRFFGDEAAYWTKDNRSPCRLPSDMQDQLILGELLRRSAERNGLDSHLTEDQLGQQLFAIRPSIKATLTYALRSSSARFSPRIWMGPLILVLALTALLDGASLTVFCGLLLCCAGLLFAECIYFVDQLPNGMFQFRELEIYERAIRVKRVSAREIPYEAIVDFRLHSDLVFRRKQYQHAAYALKLAFNDGYGSLDWTEFRWCEGEVVRGELIFLHDMLRVATNGRMLTNLPRQNALLGLARIPTCTVHN